VRTVTTTAARDAGGSPDTARTRSSTPARGGRGGGGGVAHVAAANGGSPNGGGGPNAASPMSGGRAPLGRESAGDAFWGGRRGSGPPLSRLSRRAAPAGAAAPSRPVPRHSRAPAFARRWPSLARRRRDGAQVGVQGPVRAPGGGCVVAVARERWRWGAAGPRLALFFFHTADPEPPPSLPPLLPPAPTSPPPSGKSRTAAPAPAARPARRRPSSRLGTARSPLSARPTLSAPPTVPCSTRPPSSPTCGRTGRIQ